METQMKSQVQKEFEALSAVPRRSGHNEKAIAYCIHRAEELGLDYVYDNVNQNVIISKPAAPGREDAAPVIIEGHLDMVAQEIPGCGHDFDTQGLDLYVDGDFYRAKGTTLGADDGVAAALAFAILEDDTVKNPPLEILLTTDEEIGMLSVKNADLTFLKGKYLINIDNDTEGEFVIGCAGGTTVFVDLPVKREPFCGHAYTVCIDHLKGGHSGIEAGKERANALKLMGETLSAFQKDLDFRICSLTAEGKDNAFCKAAQAIIVIREPVSGAAGEAEQQIQTIAGACQEAFRQIYRCSDAEIRVSAVRDSEGDLYDGSVMDATTTKSLVFLLNQLPFGVQNREQDLSGRLETSANIGFVETTDRGIRIVCSVRSSVAERSLELVQRIEQLAEWAGASVDTGKSYPAWLPEQDSPLIGIFRDTYRKLYQKEAAIEVVHAGLECGYILQNSNIQAAIAMGPEIEGEHTTEEHLSISSLNRSYDFLKAVLEEI